MYRKALTKQGSNKRGGKGVADKIQNGYVSLLYTNRKVKAIQRRSIVVQSMA